MGLVCQHEEEERETFHQQLLLGLGLNKMGLSRRHESPKAQAARKLLVCWQASFCSKRDLSNSESPGSAGPGLEHALQGEVAHLRPRMSDLPCNLPAKWGCASARKSKSMANLFEHAAHMHAMDRKALHDLVTESEFQCGLSAAWPLRMQKLALLFRSVPFCSTASLFGRCTRLRAVGSVA